MSIEKGTCQTIQINLKFNKLMSSKIKITSSYKYGNTDTKTTCSYFKIYTFQQCALLFSYSRMRYFQMLVGRTYNI